MDDREIFVADEVSNSGGAVYGAKVIVEKVLSGNTVTAASVLGGREHTPAWNRYTGPNADSVGLVEPVVVS